VVVVDASSGVVNSVLGSPEPPANQNTQANAAAPTARTAATVHPNHFFMGPDSWVGRLNVT
jgi:hypothetical protein